MLREPAALIPDMRDVVVLSERTLADFERRQFAYSGPSWSVRRKSPHTKNSVNARR